MFAPPTRTQGGCCNILSSSVLVSKAFLWYLCLVLTWWANHGQLLEWLQERTGTTNELQLNNDDKIFLYYKLHGSAFCGQCNLLAQHGLQITIGEKRSCWTGRMAKVGTRRIRRMCSRVKGMLIVSEINKPFIKTK